MLQRAKYAAWAAVRPLLALVLALLLLTGLSAEEADAHGGRIRPPPPRPGDVGPPPGRPPPPVPRPGPRAPPTSPPISRPTPPTLPPTTPGSPGQPPGTGPREKPTPATPAPTPPPTTGGTPDSGRPPRRPDPLKGRGRPRPGAASAESTWQMWWELNRWGYFPERGLPTTRPKTVTTPSGDDGLPKVDAREVAARRRAMVTRLHIVPFLLKHLDPKTRTRAEVRAAAALALAKVCHDDEAVDLLFRHAEDLRAPALVRESAALAVGMLRRAEADNALEGERLDAVRERLFGLIDESDAPVRTRAFAALSIGLLGDQPFGSAFTKHGRMTARALWRRLQRKHAGPEMSTALLTALGMQPSAGTSREIKIALQRIANGRRVARRSWSDVERSHALTAVVRQAGPGWPLALIRTVTNKRVSNHVRRAAFIAMGARSESFGPADRLDAANAALGALRLSRDPLTKGLGLLALGRLQGADLRAGYVAVLERCDAAKHLMGEVHHGSLPHRGFATLGLALALRDGTADAPSVERFQETGHRLLQDGFTRTKEPRTRAGYAVALGLLGADAAPQVESLTEVLWDRGADPELRGHVAVALAQIGADDAKVRKALRAAIADKSSIVLRSQAALALSFLGGAVETNMLVRELKRAKSQWVLAQVSAALGQLGDLSAVPGILSVAADAGREEEARALAIASLGLLGDPERKPSMLRLTADSNYPAKTDALTEALSIL